MCQILFVRITFLGTGTSQGVPIIGSHHPVCLSANPKDKRLRVSIMLEWENYCYIVDCGPDFRQQMLANSVEKIDGILFTHEHNDHIIGLDDIRPFYFRQGAISIHAHPRVVEALKKRFDYIFQVENKYPGAPSLSVNLINANPFQLGGREIVPIDVWHGNLQVFGFRFGDFAYITDAKTVPQEEIEKLNGIKILTINALRIEPHYSHFNLEEALAFVKKVNPERAYFTHISHLLGFHDEVEKSLPENVFLAYDNLKIEI